MDKQQTHMIHIYVGSGRTREFYTSAAISLSLSSITKYIVSDAVKSKSIFGDLLDSTKSWQLQWIKDGKGDKSVKKNGSHSIKHYPMIDFDAKLEDIGKRSQQKAIYIQIVFNQARFREWERQQELPDKIPTVTIVKCEEIPNHLKTLIRYRKKYENKYQVCYKIYSNNNNNNNSNNSVEWKKLENGSNEILVSKLWKYKKYTLEIALQNKYSGIYGKSTFKNGIEIKSHQIVFEGANSKDVSILNEEQDFETFNHKQFYRWCSSQLRIWRMEQWRLRGCW